MSMKKMLTTLSSTLSAERREFSAISAPDKRGRNRSGVGDPGLFSKDIAHCAPSACALRGGTF
jgi:hypothetical protein